MVLITAGLVFSQDSLGRNASPRDLYQEGLAYQLQERYYQAIETYKLALIGNQHYIDPMIGLAQSFFALEEYNEALFWIEKSNIYDKNRSDLKNLKGRILISRGRFSEARSLFEEVRSSEPNNLDANFGLAELEIAEGKVRSGTVLFEETLKMEPANRKALLTLTVLYDSLGNDSKSEQYIRQALHYHFDNVTTQYLAAQHYFLLEKYDLSESHAKTALAIRSDHQPSIHLLGNLYLKTNNFTEAVNFLNQSIRVNPSDHLVWYALGLAYTKLGSIDRSLLAYDRALSLRPDDEITRLALERNLIDNLTMETPLRERYALYHLRRGISFEEKNIYPKALAEFRRGMKVDPHARDIRLSYAGIYKKMGYPSKYLSELKVLADLFPVTSEIEDEIEIQSSLQEETVANTWRINQFSVETNKPRYSFALYILPEQENVDHFAGGDILLEYFTDLMLHEEHIEVPMAATILSFADGFRRARENSTDYFFIMDLAESERKFNAGGILYSSHTGSPLKNYSIMRTGNDKVTEAMVRLVDEISSDLTPIGTILERKFTTVLVNLGRMDGLQREHKFSIIRKGNLNLKSDDFGHEYTDDGIVGTLTIEESDELVSTGEVEWDGFFDMINIGDFIIPFIEEEEPQEAETEEPVEPVEEPYPPIRLYERIINIR